MIKKIVKTLKNPIEGILIFLLVYIFLPILISIISMDNIIDGLKIFFLLFVSLIFFSEIIFTTTYRLYNGSTYNFPKRIPFKKIHIEPHPYLPFIYKKNFEGPSSEKLNYNLNNNYYSANLKTNNMGFYNGESGNRDIKTPKPKDLYRINCLGGSTTGNYFFFEKKNISYPIALEKILKNKLNTQIEVNNCAEGGYNSADILVRFALQIIDTKPDMIVLYHAYNDVRSYLTPNFNSDYSHSRINLGNIYWQLKIGLALSFIPIKFFNYLVNSWFPYNMRNSLQDMISKEKINFNEINTDKDISEGLNVYERNLQHIIDLCKANDIKVVLSTYCFNLHEKVKNDNVHKIYEIIVNKENTIVKKLATKNDIIFVDSASRIPKENDLFVDTVHFSPKGMEYLARIISEKILETHELSKS